VLHSPLRISALAVFALAAGAGHAFADPSAAQAPIVGASSSNPASLSAPDAGALDGRSLFTNRSSGAASAFPHLVVEAPYQIGTRLRPDGAVVASVADEDVARWNVGGTGDPAYVSNRQGFHVAPRVVVDVAVRSGKLPLHAAEKGVFSETALLAQARSHGYWPFRLCFEDGLRENGKLHGKTDVRVRIARDGRVVSSRLGPSELRDDSVQRCLNERARALHFTPGPRRAVDATLTVDLSPGDAPLPDARAGSDANADSGHLDVAATALALSDASASISTCYLGALAADARLWGRLALQLDVGSDGVVRKVVEHDSRFPARQVVTCAVAAMNGKRLPPPAGGPASVVWAVRLGAPLDTPAPAPLADRVPPLPSGARAAQ
jgi:hypothetical protein